MIQAVRIVPRFLADCVFNHVQHDRHAGPLNDLYIFDISAGQWIDVSDIIQRPPSPRNLHGFLHIAGVFYLFGGSNTYSCNGQLADFDM